jgi:hypothetical protein
MFLMIQQCLIVILLAVAGALSGCGAGKSPSSPGRPIPEAVPPPIEVSAEHQNQRCDGHSEENTYGIIGGKYLANSSRLTRAVVYLAIVFTDRISGQIITEGSCTGLILDSNIILTAAHCFDVANANDNKRNSRNIVAKGKVFPFVRPGCEIGAADQVGIEIDKVVIHRDYLKNGESGDLAVVRLSTVIPGEPTFYFLDGNTYSFTERDKLVVAGFGKVGGAGLLEAKNRTLKMGFVSSNHGVNFREQFNQFNLRRADKLYEDRIENVLIDLRREYRLKGERFGEEEEKQVRTTLREMARLKVEERVPSFDYSDSIEALIFDQSRGEGVCLGDSGGPGLRVEDGSLRVVGIAKQVFSLVAGTDSCRFGAVYTNTSHYRDWIVAKFDDLKNEKTLAHLEGSSLFK